MSKLKLFLFTALLLTLGISASAFASDGDYILTLKAEYTSNEDVLKYLEPLIPDERIYVLKDSQMADFIKPYTEHMEKDEPVDVVFSEPDICLLTTPTDTYYYKQWNHDLINLDAAFTVESYGEGVRVAVIDSGCNAHADLADNLLTGKEYFTGTYSSDYNEYTNYTTDVTDNVGHGTHVSGIIAATMNDIGVCGVSSKAKIVPLKCFDSTGTTYATMLLHAICDAVTEFDCQVINMSWGMPSNNYYLRLGINYAIDQGVILVASSGNDTSGGDGTDLISYPAYYDDVISVGAVTSTGTVASYSYKNDRVDVVAPGSSIYSTYKSGYATLSGTSQAAPHVAGLAAIALSVNPKLTSEEFCEILTSTSVDKGDEGYDISYGYGLVDADAMIEKIMEDVPLYVSPVHKYSGKSHIHIRNNSDTPLSAISIFALYEDRALSDVCTNDVSLEKGHGITFTAPFDCSRHLFWESLENTIPIKY